jgi:hypothetical protein
MTCQLIALARVRFVVSIGASFFIVDIRGLTVWTR